MVSRPGTFRSSLVEGRTGGIPEEGSCFASIQDLRAATQDFADTQIVGKGGFATVYKVHYTSHKAQHTSHKAQYRKTCTGKCSVRHGRDSSSAPGQSAVTRFPVRSCRAIHSSALIILFLLLLSSSLPLSPLTPPSSPSPSSSLSSPSSFSPLFPLAGKPGGRQGSGSEAHGGHNDRQRPAGVPGTPQQRSRRAYLGFQRGIPRVYSCSHCNSCERCLGSGVWVGVMRVL